jgi:tetratricopeptide (TPR) repeat protein
MTRLAGLFMILTLACAPFGATGWQSAYAQSSEKEKPKKPRSVRSEVLGKTAFRYIEKAQELLAEEKYVEALEVLQDILDGTKFKPYEKAVATQTMGYVYAAQGNYKKTIQTFERALQSGDLPPRVANDLTYNLAQLYLAEDEPERALQLITQWMGAIDGDPAAEAYALKAQTHLMLDQLAPAEIDIRKALSLIEAPKQQWTRVLLSILLQQERYKEARPILEDAVERWPSEKVFWQHLTSVYYDANDEKLAFVARRAMHLQGMLKTTRELSSMAQLYLYHDVPIKAAEILQTGMDNGSIEKTEKNYELLAQAYMHAREWSKSVSPLTSAAEKSDEGRFYAQLAESYVQDEEWVKAEAALVKALDKGGLDNEANSWLLLGISRTRIEDYEAAIKAFRKAGDDDELAKDAFRWIRSIERRLGENRRQAEEAEVAEKTTDG